MAEPKSQDATLYMALFGVGMLLSVVCYVIGTPPFILAATVTLGAVVLAITRNPDPPWFRFAATGPGDVSFGLFCLFGAVCIVLTAAYLACRGERGYLMAPGAVGVGLAVVGYRAIRRGLGAIHEQKRPPEERGPSA